MGYLRKLCGTFGVLPSSFTLPPALVERDPAPFASGGYSNVYKATFRNRPIVIKVLNVITQLEREKLHKVSSFYQKASVQTPTLHLQLLVKEVVGWKWLRHENVLPFVGVIFAPLPISIASERMENGNIMEFIQANQDYNRIHLVSEGRAVLLSRVDCLGSLRVQWPGWSICTSAMLSMET